MNGELEETGREGARPFDQRANLKQGCDESSLRDAQVNIPKSDLLQGNFLVLLISRCLWQLSSAIPRPYLPLYVEALGGTAGDVGLVYSLASIGGIFLYPLGGYIADLAGRVKLVGIMTFVFSVSFLPFIFATDWIILAVGTFLQNMLLFYVPALYALEADSIPRESRGTALATMLAIPGAVGIIGPFIGGYLIEALGLVTANKVCYAFGLAAGIVVAVMRTFYLKETVNGPMPISLRNIPTLLKESYVSFGKTLRWMPNTLRSLTLMQVSKVSLVYIAGPFWVLYTTQIIGLTPYQWGQLALISGATRFITAVPAGRIIDKYGRRRLLLYPLLFSPTLGIAFLVSTSFYQVLIVFIALEAINAFLIPSFQSLIFDHVPRERRGRILAALGIGMFYIDIRGVAVGHGVLLFIPGMIAFAIGGKLYEINPVMPFLVLTAGLLLNAFMAHKFVREAEEAEV